MGNSKFYKELRKSCSSFEEYVKKLFWLRVDLQDIDKCWEWKGYIDSKGYGRTCVQKTKSKRKGLLAHKLSWWVHTGKYIKYPLCVCHHCDNPSCVNPAHLFVGTNKDNTEDRDRKGRQSKGEEKCNTKLTARSVRTIIKLNHRGWTQKKLAEMFGVSRRTIHGIIHGTDWSHISNGNVPVNNYENGEDRWSAKLNKEQVLQIREDYALGISTQKELAEEYAISTGHMSGIIRRKKWKHI